jgi:transposase
MLPAHSWLPDAALVRLEYIAAAPEGLTLVLAARREAVPCPTCGRATDRIHSRYVRAVADLPWSGWP